MKHLKQYLLLEDDKSLSTEFYDAMLKDIAEKLNIPLVSIWLFNDDFTKISCACNFDVAREINIQGVELFEKQYPKYFKAIVQDISIAADDVYSNPKTKELCKDYFEPNNIKSLLDFIIYAKNKPFSVVCCETVGEKRCWTDEDINYIRMVTVLGSTSKFCNY